jgi:hypothetical protein
MTDFDRLHGVDLTLWVRLVLVLLAVGGAGTGLALHLT